MPLVSTLRTMYRKYVYSPELDRYIYSVLDSLVNVYCRFRRFSFPNNYIRRWKLDMLLWKYEKETVECCRSTVGPGMTILDIGAHVGYYTKLFSNLVGKTGVVYAYEADPENFAILKKNTAHLPNVRIFHTAVTDSIGTTDFYHCAEKSGCHSTVADLPLKNYHFNKITVPAIDIDSSLEKEGIQTVDFVKMDIEGGEPAALRGMSGLLSKQKKISLLIEFAPDWVRAAQDTPLAFLQRLAAAGFSLSVIEHDMAPLDPVDDQSYLKFIPDTDNDDSFNEFVNLYCQRAA